MKKFTDNTSKQNKKKRKVFLGWKIIIVLFFQLSDILNFPKQQKKKQSRRKKKFF